VTAPKVVIDTNIVLDMLVFNDPASHPLRDGVASGALQWVATPAMRDELERVLAYPQIAKRLLRDQREAATVLAQFDASARLQGAAAKAPVTCKDADDQKFIDLAVANQSLLLSKDHAVLCMKKRLSSLAVITNVAIN
jgi:putative PIN family toxin of toxin-antitoxin system